APTGRLRAGINLANFLLVTGRTPAGEPDGVAPDLAREIARRLGVPVTLVAYANPGDLVAAVADWDIGLVGADPLRAGEIAFTAAYAEIEATYLVPPGSPIGAIEEVDRPGVRIAVSEKSAYDMYLRRTLRAATLVHAPGIEASFQRFVAERLDALAGLRPRLLADCARLPGSRVLPGRFTAIQQAIGTPIARRAAAAWLREFVEEAKRGLVARLIEKHRVQGLSVAAPAAPG
ncbi:MAG: transporter substrate-binding domain-containing protein, partial [Burkholderiales bacterium]|nr:transporter substrate-binding domain-containing protein [Burkholderiales bacterium]